MSEFEHKVLDPMTDEEMAVYVAIDTGIDLLRNRIELNRLDEGDPEVDSRLRKQLAALLQVRADAFDVHFVEHVHVSNAAKFEEAKKYAAFVNHGWPIPHK